MFVSDYHLNDLPVGDTTGAKSAEVIFSAEVGVSFIVSCMLVLTCNAALTLLYRCPPE